MMELYTNWASYGFKYLKLLRYVFLSLTLFITLKEKPTPTPELEVEKQSNYCP
jgi:hypothetical protein